MTVEQLPNELWVRIFSCFSDPQDFARARGTSPQFHTMVQRAYFDRIEGLRVRSSANYRLDPVVLVIISPYGTETLIRTQQTIIKTFNALWEQAPNLFQCHFEDVHLRPPTPQCYYDEMGLKRVRTHNTFLDVLRDAYHVCKRVSRKITHFKCTPYGSWMPASDANFKFYQVIESYILLWQRTITTIAMRLESEFLGDWVRIMQTTPVEDCTLHLPLPLQVAYPVLQHLMYLDPFAVAFIKLKELLHQPGRIMKRLSIYTPKNGLDLTPIALKEYMSLLIGCAPTEEFTMDHPLRFNFLWLDWLKEGTIHSCPSRFQTQLRVLHLGGRTALIMEYLTQWPYRKLFPNLEVLTNVFFTHTMVENFVKHLKYPSTCGEFHPKHLTICCQPLGVGHLLVSGNVDQAQWERLENEEMISTESFYPESRTKIPSRSPDLITIRIKCRTCPLNRKHLITILVPICFHQTLVPQPFNQPLPYYLVDHNL
jgi:hypothetical protein